MAAALSLYPLFLLPSNCHSPAISTKPRAVLSQTNKMRVPYVLKQGQSRLFHELPSGLNMEVIAQKGDPDERKKRNTENPPLVFVHGSYHAAWCWAEHWLPFFSDSGYDCYAVSLLGQGESDSPAGSVAGTLQTHAGDIADFINTNLKSPPILLGHSFGGLIIQYYIANLKNDQLLVGFPVLTVVPQDTTIVLIKKPSDIKHELNIEMVSCSGLVWRYLFTKPIAAYKVTRSLATKAFQASVPLCKETFFSASVEDQLVRRYQELMKESSRMPLFDLRRLNASLPVPSVPKSSIELLVLGAKDDFIVDTEGLKETGKFYGVSPVCIEGAAHDIMLDCSWEKGAKVIHSWLNGLKQNVSP